MKLQRPRRIGRALVTEGALVGAADATQLALIQQTSSVYVNFTQSANEVQQLRRAMAAGKLKSAGANAAQVRIVLDDGTSIRAGYDGQNGWPYTAIGRELIRRGEIDRANVSMQSIRAWLKAHPSDARKVMESDASFVFFKEQPVGDAAPR